MMSGAGKTKPWELAAYMKRHREQQTASMIETLLEVASDADVIVAGGMAIGVSTAADYLKIPYRFVAYAPNCFRSNEWEQPVVATFLSATGPIVNRLGWTLGELIGRMMSKEVNRHRVRLGLAPCASIWDGMLDRAGRPILAAHRQLASIPRDVKESVVRCGAIRQPADGEISEATERYLADGEPPIIVGFGSMLGFDPRALGPVSVAVAQTGLRAIFAGSVWDGIDLPAESLRCGAEPFDKLFPRVACVVSHGGAGTVGQAVYSGVPQVVLALGGDQPYWGRATVAAGLSPASFRLGHVDSQALARALEQSVVGPFVDKARALAADVAGSDGAVEVAGEVLRSVDSTQM
jgi:UDP:flavonoid glycosyltransferase YjiC (YdhE family)